MNNAASCSSFSHIESGCTSSSRPNVFPQKYFHAIYVYIYIMYIHIWVCVCVCICTVYYMCAEEGSLWYCFVSHRSAPTYSGLSHRAITRILTPTRTNPLLRPPGLTFRLVFPAGVCWSRLTHWVCLCKAPHAMGANSPGEQLIIKLIEVYVIIHADSECSRSKKSDNYLFARSKRILDIFVAESFAYSCLVAMFLALSRLLFFH